MAFQLAIIATGNYNFFNLLTMLLCLFLFDDRQLRRILDPELAARIKAKAPQPGRTAAVLATPRCPHRRAGGVQSDLDAAGRR